MKMEMATVTFTRENQAFLIDMAIEIIVDDLKLGELKNGETKEFEVSEGTHKFDFKCSFRQNQINADIQNNTMFKLRFNRGSGEIETEMTGAINLGTNEAWKERPRDPNMVYPDKRKTSPVVACILSVLIVGLGLMINGQLIKGLLMLIVSMIIGALTGGIAGIIIWIVSAIDAYMCVSKLKQGQPIGRFSFF